MKESTKTGEVSKYETLELGILSSKNLSNNLNKLSRDLHHFDFSIILNLLAKHKRKNTKIVFSSTEKKTFIELTLRDGSIVLKVGILDKDAFLKSRFELAGSLEGDLKVSTTYQKKSSIAWLDPLKDLISEDKISKLKQQIIFVLGNDTFIKYKKYDSRGWIATNINDDSTGYKNNSEMLDLLNTLETLKKDSKTIILSK